MSARWSGSPLWRGSVNLVANNVAATGLGFVGWIVTTRLFSVGEVGSAAATMSVALLMANIAFLGAPGTLLRFLPASEDRRRLLATAMSVALLSAAGVSLVAAVVQARGAATPGQAVALASVFVLYVVALVAKAVAEAATIAVRASHVALVATVTANAAKLVALVLLGLASGGPIGIVIAQVVAVLVNLVPLVRYLRTVGVLAGPVRPDRAVLRQVGAYAGSSYVNALAGGLPLLLLPVLVKSNLGSEAAGYWYVASLIATAMSLVSSGVGQSLLVEASHDPSRLRTLSWRAFRWLTYVAVPLALSAVVVAPWLLGVFGHGYATESLAAFRVLALSTLFSPAVYVLGTVFFVRRRIGPLLVGNIVNATVVLALADRATSLVGVALAWTVGELVYVVLFLAFLPIFRERSPRQQMATDPAG